MSLDFSLMVTEPHEIYSANITHNLGEMAQAAGIYYALWHPADIGAKTARDIIPVLKKGLAKLKLNPIRYSKFDAPNGWGTYVHFVPFVEEVLKACVDNPEADISVSI